MEKHPGFAKGPSGIFSCFRDMRAFVPGRFLYFLSRSRQIHGSTVNVEAGLAQFWIIAGIIVLLVAAILLLAALRPRRQSVAADADVALYRDQLAEIERDVARGVLSVEEAEPVQVEVSRRLLEANRRLDQTELAKSKGARIAAIASALFVLIGGPLLYLELGAPRYPDLPLSARLDAAAEIRAERLSQSEFETRIGYQEPNENAVPEQLDLLAQLKDALASRPDDLTGHEMLARFEAELGHFRGAYQAYERVITLKGEAAQASDWADYADLLVLAAGGYVSPEAEQAIARALQLDPENAVAGYYLGLMWAQTGRPDLAFGTWRSVLSRIGTDNPVRAPIEAQIVQAAIEAGVDYTPPAQTAGPSQQDVEAAAEMNAADRQAMIEGMVSGLMDRLASEGGSSAEWAQLIRALGVLGRSEDAWPIVDEARTVFANDPNGLAEIETAARTLEPRP